MKRRTLISGVAAASAVPFIGAGKAMADSSRPVTKPGRLSVGLAPTTAAGFESMFEAKNDLEWSGSDQATSFTHNGFTYWLFGDTVLGTETESGGYTPGWTLVANSIMMQVGDELVPAMENGESLAVPNPATSNSTNQERYWLQGMFAANGHLYVLCQRVMKDGTTFKLIGGELGKFKQNATTGKLRFYGMFVTPGTGQLEVRATTGIQWSSEAVVSDGYVYFYGATRANANPYIVHFSYVARVPVGYVENPFAWRFYKKSTGTWVGSIAELDQDATNQTDSIVASQVGSVRYINNKWVMVHKPWNGSGVAVRAMTSPTPYGPWTPTQSDGVVIFNSPAGIFEGKNYQTYCPQLHPEQTLDSGKTLVSIAWNFKGATLADMAASADLYKPRFFEVQF